MIFSIGIFKDRISKLVKGKAFETGEENFKT
jgi:hypothetical protein